MGSEANKVRSLKGWKSMGSRVQVEVFSRDRKKGISSSRAVFIFGSPVSKLSGGACYNLDSWTSTLDLLNLEEWGPGNMLRF